MENPSPYNLRKKTMQPKTGTIPKNRESLRTSGQTNNNLPVTPQSHTTGMRFFPFSSGAQGEEENSSKEKNPPSAATDQQNVPTSQENPSGAHHPEEGSLPPGNLEGQSSHSNNNHFNLPNRDFNVNFPPYFVNSEIPAQRANMFFNVDNNPTGQSFVFPNNSNVPNFIPGNYRMSHSNRNVRNMENVTKNFERVNLNNSNNNTNNNRREYQDYMTQGPKPQNYAFSSENTGAMPQWSSARRPTVSNNVNLDRQELISIVTQVMSTLQNLPNTSNTNQDNSQLNNIRNSQVEMGKLPIFDTKTNLHPIDFLEQLEYYYNMNRVPFEYFKYVIANHLKGEASLWGQACLNNFYDFGSFKNAFKQQFWNEDIQDEVLDKLRKTKYEGKGSLVQHFLLLMSSTKHLEPPLSEENLIKKIAKLFPPNISSCLVLTRNFSEALERLRQADAYFSREVQVSSHSHFSPTNENRSRNFSSGYSKEYAQKPKSGYRGDENRTPRVATLGVENNAKNSNDMSESENECEPHEKVLA
ncbi:unnamed protein product [Phaedon cochleariae]|uniref:Gag protein n=1 Tax=Phaedon cochleariae TaxID=80249 RepID=A0A9P0DJP4_PHACE|nr:unnamed protein product [Phaedon cochleariae]